MPYSVASERRGDQSQKEIGNDKAVAQRLMNMMNTFGLALVGQAGAEIEVSPWLKDAEPAWGSKVEVLAILPIEDILDTCCDDQSIVDSGPKDRTNIPC